jgi:hypothetical protein
MFIVINRCFINYNIQTIISNSVCCPGSVIALMYKREFCNSTFSIQQQESLYISYDINACIRFDNGF